MSIISNMSCDDNSTSNTLSGCSRAYLKVHSQNASILCLRCAVVIVLQLSYQHRAVSYTNPHISVSRFYITVNMAFEMHVNASRCLTQPCLTAYCA